MAAKKTKKRKGRKPRSAAQKAATKRMLAANKSGRKKRRKGKRRKTRVSKSVAERIAASYKRGYQGAPPSVASHYHSGARSYAAGMAAHRPKRRKGKRRRKSTPGGAPSPKKRHHGGKHHKGGVVTAATILRNAKTKGMRVWTCAGVRRTGCGGGKRGGHVVGHLR